MGCQVIPDVQITPTQLGNVKDTVRNAIKEDIEQKIVKKTQTFYKKGMRKNEPNEVLAKLKT